MNGGQHLSKALYTMRAKRDRPSAQNKGLPSENEDACSSPSRRRCGNRPQRASDTAKRANETPRYKFSSIIKYEKPE